VMAIRSVFLTVSAAEGLRLKLTLAVRAYHTLLHTRRVRMLTTLAVRDNKVRGLDRKERSMPLSTYG
jgi:hypothetical protein